MKLVAAAYCRYSRDDGDSDSVKLQIKRSKEAAKKLGATLDDKHIFVDDGISGRETKKRPDFVRCLKSAERREFNVLIVRDLDRFTRAEVLRVGGILQELTDHDVRLFEYLKGEFLRTDGEHAVMLGFNAHLNRGEALKASIRIKDKLLARDEANDGWTSQAPYGFRNARKHKTSGEIAIVGEKGVILERKDTFGVLVRDPKTFPILHQIGDLFLKLGTFNAVAMALNKKKIPSPDGNHTWAARSISLILSNPVYRGKVLRGRRTSREKAGTIEKGIKARPEEVRTYERPELRVWPVETEKKIDALIATRRVRRTRSHVTRRHLSSSVIRCGYCGGSIVATKGGGNANVTYCCDRARAGACRSLGYRAEHKVDAAVVLLCGMVVAADVLEKTRKTIRATLEATKQIESRGFELGRLSKEIATCEKAIRNHTDSIGQTDDPELRAHLLGALKEDKTRLADLQEELAKVKANEGHQDPRELLEALEARATELRAGLERGGLEALPFVQKVLGEDRLIATREPDGGWRLKGTVHPLEVFFGENGIVRVGNNQKKAIKGELPTSPALPKA